jgi:hypothetical protein
MDLRRLTALFYAVQFEEDPTAAIDRLCRKETFEEVLGFTRVDLLDLLTAALSSHETVTRYDMTMFQRPEESIRGFLQALRDRLAATSE